LSQLRDLLENLQPGNRQAQGQGGQQNQQMMQMMDQFSGIIGQQQQLMDDTFSENQGQEKGQQGQQGDEPGQNQGPGQQGQQGQQGQSRPGQGKPGQGQQGQQGQPRPGQGQEPGQGQGMAKGPLGERQGSLRDQLGELQKGLQKNGMSAPDQLGGAEQSMQNAQRALEQGDLDTATKEQGKALEQMRQGAQSMAQQMLQRQPNRYGQGPGGDAPRDPLGRPQRTEGPDNGTSVTVPNAIEMQSAREILEELRRRLGDPSRPSGEIDYIERLLRRF
jgi:hypothetical protein